MTDAWRDSYDAWLTTPPEPDSDPDDFGGAPAPCDVCGADAWRDAPWCVALCDGCADALPTSDCAACPTADAGGEWRAIVSATPGDCCIDCIHAANEAAAPRQYRPLDDYPEEDR